MRDGRTFDAITKLGGESGAWRTIHGAMDPPVVADAVLNPDLVIGLRHRAETRALTFDIDAHAPNPSPYWHPDGPDRSAPVQRLLSELENIGAVPVIVRTPSAGWHIHAVVPEAVPTSEAAHLARLVTARAGLVIAPGHLETFPSPQAFDGSAPWLRRRSAGFRLPGQQGSSLWLGGTRWTDELDLIWLELAAAAELASDATASSAWLEVRQLAQAARRAAEPRPRRIGPAIRRRANRTPGVSWSAPGQSNANLGRLAARLWQTGDTPASLAPRIVAAALQAPGFNEHASDDTKQRLESWALSWAAACCRKPPRPVTRPTPRTLGPRAGLNHARHRTAVLAVIDGALRLAKELGDAAQDLSQRSVAELLSIGRPTLRKLWTLWKSRITQAVFRRRRGPGQHPCAQGVVFGDGGTSASGCSPAEGVHLCPAPPPTERPDRPPRPPTARHDPPAMPTRAPARPGPRAELERAELAAWLGITP